MLYRDRIKQTLDKEPAEFFYDELKACLSLDPESEQYKQIDLWFNGIIESLNYMPNNYSLVVKTDDEYSEQFFINLLPNNIIDPYYKEVTIYDCLIKKIEFQKNLLNISMNDNFILFEDNIKNMVEPSCDKRLCSYYSVVKTWRYPQRKSIIVIEPKEIDWDRFFNIPKLDLWIDIYNIFK